MARGFIYLLENPAMPGIVKIGRTGREPKRRVAELSGATGVPLPFRLAYCRAVPDMQAAEALLHSYFERLGQRVSSAREFFSIPLPEAMAAMDAVWRAQANAELEGLLELGFPDEAFEETLEVDFVGEDLD